MPSWWPAVIKAFRHILIGPRISVDVTCTPMHTGRRARLPTSGSWWSVWATAVWTLPPTWRRWPHKPTAQLVPRS